MNSNTDMFNKMHQDLQIRVLEFINAQQIEQKNTAMTLAEFQNLPTGIKNMLLENDVFSLAISLVYARMLEKASKYRRYDYRQFANFVVAEIFDGDLSHKTKLSAPEQKKIRNEILAIWKKGLKTVEKTVEKTEEMYGSH